MLRNAKIFLFPVLVVATLVFHTGCGGDLDQFAQDNLYPIKSANKTPVPETAPEGYVQHTLPLIFPEGPVSLHFWSYEHKGNKDAPVVIFLHGNGDNLGSLAKGNFLKTMESLESHFVVLDYPGYGRSTGTPSQESIMAFVDATMVWTKIKFPDSKIVVWGWSLGAAVAAQTAHRYRGNISGFILASPWTNVKDLARLHFGSLAEKLSSDWYSKNTWDSLGAASGTTEPGLIFHGEKDATIPFSMGEEIAEQHNASRVSFVPIPDRAHNDIFLVSELWTKVKEFIHNH